MIEHVATGEQQDSNEAKTGPQIAVSYDWQGVRRQNGEQSYHTHEDGDCRDNSHVIDWADERGFWAFRKMSADPCVELVGRNWARRLSSTQRTRVADARDPYPVKSNLTGALSTLAKGPTVGGNKRRTGAV